jgi:hypothetical protein
VNLSVSRAQHPAGRLSALSTAHRSLARPTNATSQLSTCSDRWTSAARPLTTLSSRLFTRTQSALSAHMQARPMLSARSAPVVSMVVSLSGTCKYNNNNNTIMLFLVSLFCQPSASVSMSQSLNCPPWIRTQPLSEDILLLLLARFSKLIFLVDFSPRRPSRIF